MKVVMVVDNKFDNDSRVQKEALSLSKAGYEVVVYAQKKSKESTEEQLNGVKLKRPVWGYHVIRLKLWQYFRDILPAYKSLVNEKANVYHAHDLTALVLAFFAAKKIGAKTVYDSHEFWPKKTNFYLNFLRKFYGTLKTPLESFLEGYIISRVDKVITVNDSIAGLLSKYYKISKPLVIYNYPVVKSKIKLRSDYLRKRLNLSDKDKIALYLGGINKYRGLENLIRCVQFLSTNVKVAIVGYGYLKQRLINMIDELSLKKRIYVLDAVKPNEVLDLASSADIGVSPIQNASVSYYYSSPNKVFEYLASGLPIAVSDFPEMKKIIKEDDVGATFDPEDPKDIARAIKEIFSDETKYKQMKENALKAAKEKYNWENEEKKLINLYRGLLN